MRCLKPPNTRASTMNAQSIATLLVVVLFSASQADALNDPVDAPGTPTSGYVNSGADTVYLNGGGGIGVQPIFTPLGYGTLTTIPGDVVILKDPAGGDAPANWAAVLEFFNPGDLTGALGLDATLYQTFRSNNTPGGFANLTLFPNTVYLPDSYTNSDGSITCVYTEFGPVGQIIAGQEAITTLVAANQPDLVGGGSGNVPEPATWTLVAGATLLLFVAVRRRPGGGGAIRVPHARESDARAT